MNTKTKVAIFSMILIIIITIPLTMLLIQNQKKCKDGYQLENKECVLESKQVKIDSGKFKQFYWDNSILPFEIDSDLSFNERLKVTQAIEEFLENTKITLVPKTIEESWVIFSNKKKGCFSMIGKYTGGQEISVDNCSKTEIMHEIMHTLGWVHEHSRTDRDQFIKVDESRIQEDSKGEYAISYFDWIGTKIKTPYDYNSIMHYNKKDFSKNDEDVFSYTFPYEEYKKTTFSKTDLQELDIYYQITSN